MRYVSAAFMSVAFGLLIGCTDEPSAPVTTKAQFDVAPGSEISQVTGSVQELGAFDNKVNALTNSRRISADTQKQLLDYSARLQQSIRKK